MVKGNPGKVDGTFAIVDHLSVGDDAEDHLCYVWCKDLKKLFELCSGNLFYFDLVSK